MLIGLLSDTHDHIQNIRLVLNYFRQNRIYRIIHCGDLSSTEAAREFGGFQVVYLQGNMDVDSLGIRRTLVELNPSNSVLPLFSNEIDGISIAAVHGNIPGMIHQLASTNKYDLIFHGHTHRRRDEIIFSTRVINPGALGGLSVESRSFCVVDLEKKDVRFIELSNLEQ